MWIKSERTRNISTRVLCAYQDAAGTVRVVK